MSALMVCSIVQTFHFKPPEKAIHPLVPIFIPSILLYDELNAADDNVAEEPSMYRHSDEDPHCVY